MLFLRALIPALAICFSLSASADEPSPAVKTALNKISADFVQGWNKQQPSAMAALFTRDGLYVAPTGTYTGQAGVQQYYETTFSVRPETSRVI